MFKNKSKYQNNYMHASDKSSSSKEAKPKKKRFTARLIHNILDGTIFTREKFIKLLPFAFYLVFLLVLYISKIYSTEKKLIEINKINKQLKELRFEYITSKSKVLQLQHSSSVAIKLKETGIKIPIQQPQKIHINK